MTDPLKIDQLRALLAQIVAGLQELRPNTPHYNARLIALQAAVDQACALTRPLAADQRPTLASDHPYHEAIIALNTALAKMQTIKANSYSARALEFMIEAIQHAEHAAELTEYALDAEDDWNADGEAEDD